MKFREIGNTRGKECDSFSFRVMLTEDDVKHAVNAIINSYSYVKYIAFQRKELLEAIMLQICTICKIQFSDIFKKYISSWAFDLAVRKGYVNKVNIDGEQLYIITGSIAERRLKSDRAARKNIVIEGEVYLTMPQIAKRNGLTPRGCLNKINNSTLKPFKSKNGKSLYRLKDVIASEERGEFVKYYSFQRNEKDE